MLPIIIIKAGIIFGISTSVKFMLMSLVISLSTHKCKGRRREFMTILSVSPTPALIMFPSSKFTEVSQNPRAQEGLDEDLCELSLGRFSNITTAQIKQQQLGLLPHPRAISRALGGQPSRLHHLPAHTPINLQRKPRVSTLT